MQPDSRLGSPFYYAPCGPHRDGCRGCGGAVAKGRRFYCDDNDCRLTFESNHFYRTAARAALHFAIIPSDQDACDGSDGTYCHRHPGWVPHAPMGRPLGFRCARCLDLTYRPEVNHIRPLNGNRLHFGCQHHLQNLEVLCHDCHLRTTAWQRETGLIGAAR